jgi:hypothetical protein
VEPCILIEATLITTSFFRSVLVQPGCYNRNGERDWRGIAAGNDSMKAIVTHNLLLPMFIFDHTSFVWFHSGMQRCVHVCACIRLRAWNYRRVWESILLCLFHVQTWHEWQFIKDKLRSCYGHLYHRGRLNHHLIIQKPTGAAWIRHQQWRECNFLFYFFFFYMFVLFYMPVVVLLYCVCVSFSFCAMCWLLVIYSFNDGVCFYVFLFEWKLWHFIVHEIFILSLYSFLMFIIFF